MKKLLSSVLTIAMAASLLAGCGTKAPAAGAGGTIPAAKGPVTISVMSWNDAADALTACVPGFEAANPNVKVNVMKLGNADVATKTTATFAAGSGAPDMIQFQQAETANYYKKFPKSFVDLEPYFAKEPGLKDKFEPWVWSNFSNNGKAYAFPWDIGPAGMYYRTDIFKDAGIDVSTIKTYDDYIAAGKVIVAKTAGKTKMLGINYTGIWNYTLFLRQQGAQLFKDNGDINFNSPEFQNVLNLEKKMKDAGITIDDRGDWNQGITNMNNNSVATIIYPVWYAGTMMNSAKSQSGKWAVAPLPAFTAGGSTSSNDGGSAVAITSQSKHPQEAFNFLKYCFATTEGNTIQIKYGLYPSYTPFYTESAFTAKWDYFGGQPIYSFFADVAKQVKPFTFTSDFLELAKPIQDEGTTFLAGKQDASKTLDNVANIVNQKTKRPISK